MKTAAPNLFLSRALFAGCRLALARPARVVWEGSVRWGGGEQRRAGTARHSTAWLGHPAPLPARWASGCGAREERAYRGPMLPPCPEPATGQTGHCYSSSVSLLPRHQVTEATPVERGAGPGATRGVPCSCSTEIRTWGSPKVQKRRDPAVTVRVNLLQRLLKRSLRGKKPCRHCYFRVGRVHTESTGLLGQQRTDDKPRRFPNCSHIMFPV